MLKSEPHLHDANQKDVIVDHWTLSRREFTTWILVVLGIPAMILAIRFAGGRPETTIQVHVEAQPGKSAVIPRPSLPSARLDLNKATSEELVLLPGIGPRRAELIIQRRTDKGPFRSVWELQEIKGISKRTVERLEPLLETQGLPDLP